MIHLLVTQPNGNAIVDEIFHGGLTMSGGQQVLSNIHIGPDFLDNAPLGTYTYTLTIDPDNNVAETDETNNVYTGTFEVVEGEELPVDINFTSVVASPWPSGAPAYTPGNSALKFTG